MQFQPQAALRNQDTGVYLIARAMASAEAAEEIRCAQCDEPFNISDARVRRRNKHQFACGKCISVDVRIRSRLGTWGMQEMKGCSEQDKFDFYRAAAASVGAHSLQAQVIDVLRKQLRKRNDNRNVSESLVSGVWEARGEDVIERHESKVDATQGVLYPINVEQDIDDVAETVEHRLRDLMPKTKCVKETLETLPNMPSPDRDAQDPLFKKNDDADVSFSSSSPNSSPDRKKNKKNRMGSGSKSKKQLKKEPHAKLAAQKQTDLERQRKAAEKQATAEERVQSLIRCKADKTLVRHAKKAKVATQDASAKIAVAKIKTDASKVLARLAGPRAHIGAIMARGEWESVPPITKLLVRTIP